MATMSPELTRLATLLKQKEIAPAFGEFIRKNFKGAKNLATFNATPEIEGVTDKDALYREWADKVEKDELGFLEKPADLDVQEAPAPDGDEGEAETGAEAKAQEESPKEPDPGPEKEKGPEKEPKSDPGPEKEEPKKTAAKKTAAKKTAAKKTAAPKQDTPPSADGSVDSLIDAKIAAALEGKGSGGGGTIDQDALNGMIDARLDKVLEKEVRALMSKVFAGK